MWNDDMNDIEEAVCKKYNVKYGVFTGNGTTAMYLAFQALGMQKKGPVSGHIVYKSSKRRTFCRLSS